MNTPTNLSSPEKSSTAPTVLTSPRSHRKTRQEASDESTSSRIDSRVPLRQGYPTPLLPLPLSTGPVAANTEDTINWSSARETMLKILNKHDVNEFSMSWVNRLVPSSGFNSAPEYNSNLTCLIITRRNLNSNSWYLALKDIEEQFEMDNLRGFTVEFIDPELCKPAWPRPIGQG